MNRIKKIKALAEQTTEALNMTRDFYKKWGEKPYQDLTPEEKEEKQKDYDLILKRHNALLKAFDELRDKHKK